MASRQLRAAPPDGADHAGAVVRLRFEVADEGIGMSERELARAFQPFEQAADARRREGGTGLGLAISRDLAQAMGGDLVATSEVGRGSTFIFTLPLSLVATEREHV